MCHDLAMQNRAFLTVAIAVTALAMAACSSEPEVSPEKQDRKFTSALVAEGFHPDQAENLLPVGRLVCPNIEHGRTNQELLNKVIALSGLSEGELRPLSPPSSERMAGAVLSQAVDDGLRSISEQRSESSPGVTAAG